MLESTTRSLGDSNTVPPRGAALRSSPCGRGGAHRTVAWPRRGPEPPCASPGLIPRRKSRQSPQRRRTGCRAPSRHTGASARRPRPSHPEPAPRAVRDFGGAQPRPPRSDPRQRGGRGCAYSTRDDRERSRPRSRPLRASWGCSAAAPGSHSPAASPLAQRARRTARRSRIESWCRRL
eukprot:6179231-Prymnesium_polylepis.2